MDEVEAVTAVLWRHLEPTPHEAPGVEAGKILMRGVAQEAIAALDACRRENRERLLARMIAEEQANDAGSPTPPGSD